ncbi:MAG TPA: DUF3078 domain-containing protein [Saprospiraceae bacterium]|nr:DUF3078 domain-containing protein [Saprospiraceae bacterium]
MTKKILLIVAIVFSGVMLFAQADDKRLEEVSKMAKQDAKEGWIKGGGIGLDFTGLRLINPRVGAGDNKFGIGGLGTFFFNYKKGKDYWNNGVNFQLAVQNVNLDAKRLYQKNLDVVRFNSRYGHQIKEKLFGAVDFGLETLLLPTYSGNFTSPETAGDNLIAKLFSPARITFSPGLDYKHDDHFSVFFAPIGLKIIYVADQDIANLGIHGTKLVEENDPSKGFEQMFLQAGANLQAKYNNKFISDKVSYTTQLDLFSNYLNNPQNIDVLWGHALDISIAKGLSLSLMGELFYDHDILVNFDRDGNGRYDGTPNELARRVSMTGGYYLKYSKVF